jgi:type II restriction enzyme
MPYNEKIIEGLEILRSIGIPDNRINERTSMCLIALLGLEPDSDWVDSINPLLGIRGILDFIRSKINIPYAENTRETIRDESVKTLVYAGILLPNPDDPARSKNSSKFCYQVVPEALDLFRSFGSDDWESKLEEFVSNKPTLIEKYARIRTSMYVRLVVNNDSEILLSAGIHSELIKKIIDDFKPRFAPDSQIIYIGETGSKWDHFEPDPFIELGIALTNDSQMPDVVLFDSTRNWLFLIESVTSNGPIDGRRYEELISIFNTNNAFLVFVTAFLDRPGMRKFLTDLAWETEVWVADSPDHLIHFNGDKFLGPYQP